MTISKNELRFKGDLCKKSVYFDTNCRNFAQKCDWN